MDFLLLIYVLAYIPQDSALKMFILQLNWKFFILCLMNFQKIKCFFALLYL
jgi:hypothetical protein